MGGRGHITSNSGSLFHFFSALFCRIFNCDDQPTEQYSISCSLFPDFPEYDGKLLRVFALSEYFQEFSETENDGASICRQSNHRRKRIIVGAALNCDDLGQKTESAPFNSRGTKTEYSICVN